MHEALRRKHPIDYLSDCQKCMKDFDQTTRRHMGCGYETPMDGARPWSPANLDSQWRFSKDEANATTCPGYVTMLPEVVEISRARVHAKEFGGLVEFCDGQPSELMRQGVEILEGASNECQRWVMDNPEARK